MKQSKQVRIWRALDTITVTFLPDTGFDGKGLVRLGIDKNGSDQEMLSLDPFDAKQLADALRKMATSSARSSAGHAGGRARADKLSPEQRSEIARQGATAKWDHEEDVA